MKSAVAPMTVTSIASRTPHGVRGLKYTTQIKIYLALCVAPLTGCVD